MRTFGSKPASIPYSRWTAYGAAATASAFVCASSAEAEIHYSGVVNHNFANGSFAGPLDPGVTLTLGAFGLSSRAEAEIHYSGDVSIKLTGNAQASLPLSNGASLEFRNIFGGSTFLQHFHFYVKGVISGSARGYFQSASGSRNWLSNLGPRENVSAGEFLPVTGNPGFGSRRESLFAPSVSP